MTDHRHPNAQQPNEPEADQAADDAAGESNRPAEGDAEAVTRFERSLRQGPIGARVDDVLVDLQPASGRFTDFRILP